MCKKHLYYLTILIDYIVDLAYLCLFTSFVWASDSKNKWRRKTKICVNFTTLQDEMACQFLTLKFWFTIGVSILQLEVDGGTICQHDTGPSFF